MKKGIHIRTRLDEMMKNQKKADQEIEQERKQQKEQFIKRELRASFAGSKNKRKKWKPVTNKVPRHQMCRCAPIEVIYDIYRN